MFRTLAGAADPIECCEEIEKDIEQGAGNGKSSASTKSDSDAVERASTQDGIEAGENEGEKRPPRPTSELKRTISRGSNTSRALSRVGSRFTTHSIKDPGPAPDGGFKAWLQVAMGWLAIAITWGWVNCFGE